MLAGAETWMVGCAAWWGPPTMTWRGVGATRLSVREWRESIIWMLCLPCRAVEDHLLQRISPVLADYVQLSRTCVSMFVAVFMSCWTVINSLICCKFTTKWQMVCATCHWWRLSSNKKTWPIRYCRLDQHFDIKMSLPFISYYWAICGMSGF